MAKGLPGHLRREWNRVTTKIAQKHGQLQHLRGSFGNLFMNRPERQPALIGPDDSLNSEHFLPKHLKKFQLENKPRERDWALVRKASENLNIRAYEMQISLQSCWTFFKPTYSRSMAVRFYGGLLYGNRDFFKFSVIQSPNCLWCPFLEQDYSHLVAKCPKVTLIRSDIDTRFRLGFNEKNWVLIGDWVSNTPASHLIPLLFIEYLYRSNHKQLQISTEGFIAKLKYTEERDLFIANRKGKLADHNNIWGDIKAHF